MLRGVGVIGAGPGVEALHLPTLARLDGRLRVVHVADGGSGRAAALAARLGARHSSGAEALLADPGVDVVAICSPPERHAEQILAAVAAGKRAILCEKPLALTSHDASRVVEACRETGTALVVGTNHLFDPAWARAKRHIVARGVPVRAISATLSLPPNPRYHALVAEPESPPPPAGDGGSPPRGGPDLANPAIAAAVVRSLLTGLAVHDLPLVRDLAPAEPEVLFARPVPPLGYCVGLLAGDVLVTLSAVMAAGGADALWRVSVATRGDRIDVEFPPAFVHAGSAGVRVRDADGRSIEYPRSPENGYAEEWRALLDLLDGGHDQEYAEILSDALCAIRLADGAVALLGGEAGARP